MGTYYGYHSRPALVAELTGRWRSGEKHMETVAHTLRGNVLWAVHRWVDDDDRVISTSDNLGGHFIYAYLLMVHGGDWGYKPLEESCGPCYYTCPLKYFGMAAGTNPSWREKVRAYHRAKTRKLEVGQWYEYASEGIVRISRMNPLCGWVDGTEYRLTHKGWIGECLTA
ncbi:MAG: hypothetical protein PHE17_14915 [Thiothrix sp.]|uniref:hypothetical protein n=1 Tax=Thiothrix sp. TaxID=1032 RepID=UPI0026173756|nr:hypothetical protein [Thiothrix sp.]MDD5394303.1 hypothetical protein [Thiothrix sp.]